ncbi:MAG: glycosyltransferase [Proteobacteria bacterium]|nr:glycosyltransferase [Pseudomonadota bacterium]
MNAPRQNADWKNGLDVISLQHELARCCGLSPTDWSALLRRAHALETDPFDLAMGEGLIPESRFLEALAGILGAQFMSLAPPAMPGTVGDEAFAMRSYRGQDVMGDLLRVMAPSGAQAGLLLRQLLEGRLPPLALVTRQALLERLIEQDRDRMARRALLNLPEALSARPPIPYDSGADGLKEARAHQTGLMIFALALFLALTIAIIYPLYTVVLLPVFMAPVFVVAGIAVLIAAMLSIRPSRAVPPLHSAHLPRYSVLVPLYDEANIAPQLMNRLRMLAYPRDRLEVFLLVEEDDFTTLSAIRKLALPSWIHVFPVPGGSPRTKPRALNAALPFCTGDLLVVFDAEDSPDPDQLLRAAALFAQTQGEVACLQARLAIINPRDGFLTRRFAIEYAALFDCTKAGAARAGWPVPLGGSSNHFRLPVLRQIGGWDAWNVTEDADLGIRIARFGWRVEDLPSTTWEEAPNTLVAWLHQRARWMKGWMQTLMVQSRMPLQLMSQLGITRMAIIASMGLGTLLGALLYPVFLFAILVRSLHPSPLGSGALLLQLGDWLLVSGISLALMVEIIPATIAIIRRRAYFLLPWILLAPASHMLVSWAAWRGLWELLNKPYHWNKTAHGAANTEGGLAPAEWDRDFKVALHARIKSRAPRGRASYR